MSTENDITFDDSQLKIRSRSILGQPEVPGMANFLVRKRIVKNERHAMFILFGAIIVMFILSGFLIYKATVVPNAVLVPINNVKK